MQGNLLPVAASQTRHLNIVLSVVADGGIAQRTRAGLSHTVPPFQADSTASRGLGNRGLNATCAVLGEMDTCWS